MPSLQGGRAPGFHFTQNTVFATSRNDKTIVNDGNIAITTFKRNFPLTFSDLLPNCWQSTGVRKCDGITRLFTLTRHYKCVAEEKCKTAEVVTWAEGLSTETVGEDIFLAKNWTKYESRPFFGLLLILNQKPDQFE